ncbi:MAG: hypothetical protein IPP34_01055 [Bacteroidetes bacterium]|nr:hypothetical protein [Bacteroidota bacterium]
MKKTLIKVHTPDIYLLLVLILVLSNNSKILGKTTFKTQVSGYGFSLTKANAKMDGNITSLFLNGYDYKTLQLMVQSPESYSMVY